MVGMGKIKASSKKKKKKKKSSEGAEGAVGEGSLEYAVKNKNKYPYLVDEDGNWAKRMDVRYTVPTSKANIKKTPWDHSKIDYKIKKSTPLSVKNLKKIGVEVGIGHFVGNSVDAPVLLIKSCIGNRALGWDLLPPGSKQFEFEGYIYTGYKDSPQKWEKGTKPEKKAWYAGLQYDMDTLGAKKVLEDLNNQYPGANGYEVAGFF
jgi:hypothetical protein